MDDEFLLPVTYNSTELEYPARLRQYGYGYKIEVDINDITVLFEPDEERNWRALVSMEDMQHHKTLHPELLQAIAASLEEITK